MASLPTSAQLTGAGITEGDFKAAVQNVLLYLEGLLGTDGVPATARNTLKTLCSSTYSPSTAYTVTTADAGRVIRCTGTWSLTLPSAAIIGDGFAVAVANVSTGTITVSPVNGQTVDGGATLELSAGMSLILSSNGANWVAVGRGVGATGSGASGTWGISISGNAATATTATTSTNCTNAVLKDAGVYGVGVIILAARYGYGSTAGEAVSGSTLQLVSGSMPDNGSPIVFSLFNVPVVSVGSWRNIGNSFSSLGTGVFQRIA